MKISLKLLVALSAAVLSAVWASTALAAAPSNDTFPNATVASIGFSQVLDTTQATTDADDAQLNASCGAPATDASVWYALQGSDQNVIVDVSQSDYSAGVLVGTGTEGNLQTVACGPGTVSFFAAAGTTYYILAIDDQNDGGGNGGSLNISFNAAPPPPTVSISVNPRGTVNTRTGVAHVTGTYTCTNGDFIDLFINAQQNVGRFSVLGSGEFFDSGTCDGTTQPWSADIIPQNGKFAGGKAITVSDGFACGAFECSDSFVQQTVFLRGSKH
jgi:hypothetical protein